MANSKGWRPRQAQTVRLVLDGGKSVTAVARDLDLARTARHNWVKQARADCNVEPPES